MCASTRWEQLRGVFTQTVSGGSHFLDMEPKWNADIYPDGLKADLTAVRPSSL